MIMTGTSLKHLKSIPVGNATYLRVLERAGRERDGMRLRAVRRRLEEQQQPARDDEASASRARAARVLQRLVRHHEESMFETDR